MCASDVDLRVSTYQCVCGWASESSRETGPLLDALNEHRKSHGPTPTGETTLIGHLFVYEPEVEPCIHERHQTPLIGHECRCVSCGLYIDCEIHAADHLTDGQIVREATE